MEYYKLLHDLQAGAKVRQLDMQCKFLQKNMTSEDSDESSQNELSRLRAQQKNAQAVYRSAKKILFTLCEPELRGSYSLIKDRAFEINEPTFGEYRDRVAEFLVWENCKALKEIERDIDCMSLSELMMPIFYQVAQIVSDECECIELLSMGKDKGAQKIEQIISPLLFGASPVISADEILVYFPEHKACDSKYQLRMQFLYDVAAITFDSLLKEQSNGQNALENFKYGAPLESYIYDVAKNYIIHIKKSTYNTRKVAPDVNIDDNGHVQFIWDSIPDDQDKNDVPFDLKDVLDKFTPEEQIFIRRAFIEDLPVDSVCDEMGFANATYHRMKNRLKKELAVLLVKYK